MAQVLIDRDLLVKWQRELDEPKLPKNACFNVSEEIYDFLAQAEIKKEKPKTARAQSVPFNTVILGDEYELFNIKGVKYAPLNGKKCKVFQKNRTRLVVELLEDAGTLFPVGKTVTVYPEHIRELQDA